MNGLQICIAAAVSVALPSLSVHSLLSPVTSAKQEMLSVCRAPDRVLSSQFETSTGNTCILDKGNTVWKASNGVKTGLDSTSYVEGHSSTKLEVQEGFTWGPIASIDISNNIGTLNTSDIKCLTFWIKSSKPVDSDVFQLRLMDNTDSTSSLDIDIPENALNGRDWNRVNAVFPIGSNTENEIDTVSLFAAKHPGNVTIWLDIIETGISSGLPKAKNSRLKELVLNHNEGIITAG